MNILIIGQYYYPENFSINSISAELAAQGHRVTMLTGLPDYSTGKVPKEYRFFRKRRETINGVDVIRVPIIARRHGIFFRALNYGSFLLSSSICAAFMKKEFDCIFAYQTSPVFIANAGRIMKRRTKKNFFIYCLDLWPESLKAWGVTETSAVFRAVHRYSRKLYACCDILGVSSKPFIEYMTQVNGIAPKKIVYLPQHGADRGESLKELPSPKKSTNVILTYAGNIGAVQDVECIVKAVSLLANLDGFHVNIFGSGSNYDSCTALAADLKVEDKITFFGRVDSDSLNGYYMQTDAFLLTLKCENFIGMTLPAKVQDYMSCGKPIIAAAGGAAAQTILEANCGFVSPASDAAALAKIVTEYVTNIDKYKYMNTNARRYYEDHFTLKLFIDRLCEYLSF